MLRNCLIDNKGSLVVGEGIAERGTVDDPAIALVLERSAVGIEQGHEPVDRGCEATVCAGEEAIRDDVRERGFDLPGRSEDVVGRGRLPLAGEPSLLEEVFAVVEKARIDTGRQSPDLILEGDRPTHELRIVRPAVPGGEESIEWSQDAGYREFADAEAGGDENVGRPSQAEREEQLGLVVAAW